MPTLNKSTFKQISSGISACFMTPVKSLYNPNENYSSGSYIE